MVSASMDIQDQSGGSGSSTCLSTGNGIPLVAGAHSVNSVQLRDQFAAGDDYAPKVRKPYTITKQRERWTEEEHKKFLEALKLYGRAWRRIEEHVGTKTAVQIRSHAQKFFSKVVRESSSSDANSVKPIEIPPPRPKRKPMHPYPRKVASSLKTGTHLPDQQRRSMSPNLSVSEQENQSPVSVLSAIGSDTELSTPNSSQSPVSSNAGGISNGLLQSNSNPSPEENGSSSPVQENASSIQENGSSTPDEQVPMKLELFPQENDFVKDGLGEAASTQSLKLFGKTVLVTDSHRPTGNCKLPSPDTIDERRAQWNIMPMKFSQGNDKCAWNALPCGAPAALYYMQFPTESSDPVNAGVSCWNNPFGGVSFPFLQLHNAESHPSSDVNDAQEKELQKEVSWTGSNTGSVNVGGDGDKSWELETQSYQPFFDKQENEQKPRFGAIFRNPDKRTRGFVPYKRCLAERDTHSSTITGEDREELRIRLCL